MRLILPMIVVASASVANAQTPGVAAVPVPAIDRCEALPISGTGSATGVNGMLTVSGPEGRRDLRLDGHPVQRLGADVASASIRGACRSGKIDYYLIGVATPRGSCPVRYQVAEIGAAKRLRLSPRFGSCTDGGTAALANGELRVTMPAGAGSPVNVSYSYRAGRIEAVSPPVVVAEAPPPPPPRRMGRLEYRLAAWNAATACAVVARAVPLRSEAPTADILLANFQHDWPRDWQSRGRLSHQPFTRASMRAVVTDLACLASLPGGERSVTRAARPLFESRAHGKMAFDQLDVVARGAAVDPGIRAAARQFHAQMRFEVDDPRLR